MRSDGAADALPLSIVKNMPNPSSIVTVGSDGGLQEGDLVVLGDRGGNKVCTVMQLSQPPKNTGNGVNLVHNSGNGSPYNPKDPFPVAYVVGDIAFRYGDGTSFGRRFSVRCDHLVESDPVDVADAAVTCANSTPMVAQVVDLQAEYGVVDGGALTWRSATGDWAALDADETAQIRAIRVGVVTRHPQFEKTAVPAAQAPAWMGEATTDLIAANPNYRHRVFETVIPLRNVVWAP